MKGPVANIFSRGSAKAHMSWLEKVFSAKGCWLVQIRFSIFENMKLVETCLTMKDDPEKILHGAMSLQGGRCFLSDRTEMLAGPYNEFESVQLYIGFPSIQEAQKAWDIAVENGAKVKMEFKAQEWGRQYGILTDPFGVTW